MDFTKWIEAGERLGLEGSELREYAEKKETEYLDREERAKARNQRWAEQQRDDENKRRAFEIDEENKRRAFELEIKARDLEILTLRSEMPSEGSKPMFQHTSSSSPRPKLPKFEEEKDNMDV